jgi:UDP-N-acetylglucosamine 2-epimerase
MRVLTVVGARPQFIKCAAVSRVLRARPGATELLVHTGQHHDHGMSELFFEELAIPAPDHNLGIRGGPHGQMTGRMLEALEEVLLARRPDRVLVYGDTNSTLAGALAAAKLNIPVAHVEAGLRSFNRRMPEEVNRVLTDHLAALLLCPTANAVALLEQEGLRDGVHLVGDVMYDSVLGNLERARTRRALPALLAELGLSPDPDGRFALATIHRPENTDDRARLEGILEGLAAAGIPVLLPLHPRTRAVLAADPSLAARLGPALRVVEPLGYLELLLVASGAQVVLTDSGGLQKEAFFLGVRCVTLRGETEWPETIAAGANTLAGADPGAIAAACRVAAAAGRLSPQAGAGLFGDGHAAERIADLLLEF